VAGKAKVDCDENNHGSGRFTIHTDAFGHHFVGGGYARLEATSAEDALVSLRPGGKPDMIMTDLKLAGMCGIGLIREVRKLPGHRFTPIVMLSTESQQGKQSEAKYAGASGWMVKPFHIDSLLEVVRQFLPARRAQADCEKRCGAWFDKLTMRFRPLKSRDLILSLSKDDAKNSAFSAAC
jgi:two-component system chemotaxis response regulator CheY